jgi:ketosteroid isomerase-like protein
MSQENLEIVRRAVDGFNRGDFEAFVKDWAPGSELDWSRAVGPLNGLFRFDQMRQFWDELLEPWESSWIELEELIDAGEQVVVTQTGHSRGRGGIEVGARITQVWTIQDGRIVRVCLHRDKEEALEAAGLSE